MEETVLKKLHDHARMRPQDPAYHVKKDGQEGMRVPHHRFVWPTGAWNGEHIPVSFARHRGTGAIPREPAAERPTEQASRQQSSYL